MGPLSSSLPFQSALALSGEGNSANGKTTWCSTTSFNPPSPFRARGTGGCSSMWGLSDVSIRPRPFGRGEQANVRCMVSPASVFQSALALSGEGNIGHAYFSARHRQFQSALALSGEGNVKAAASEYAATVFQSALALSGEGNASP